jgi:hypothetical protein
MEGTVRAPLQLRGPAEMKVRMARVTDRPAAVMAFESIHGLGLLDLGHLGYDDSNKDRAGPIRKIRTDVVEIAVI